MSNDILRDSIEKVANKYVQNNVKVTVYKPYSRAFVYILQIEYNNLGVSYELDPRYCICEDYILRIVSDLCRDIASRTNKERDYYFKKSDETL